MDEKNRHPSTKFTLLNDSETVADARKRYFVWITAITVLFCVTGTYFFTQFFIRSKTNHSSLSPMSDVSPILKLYNPKPLLAQFRQTHNQFRPQSEEIPGVLIQKIFDKKFEKIDDFIFLDLLLHYRSLMRKNRREKLKEIFNEYQSKLSLVRNSRDFLYFLRGLKSDKFKFYAKHLKEDDFELKDFQILFAFNEELDHWYNYLTRLSVYLSSYNHQKRKNYFLNCTELNFNNFTEDTQKLLFRFVYPISMTEKKLQEINQVIQEWEKPFKIQLIGNTIVFHGKLLIITDVNKVLRRLDTSHLKFAYFFASHIIYLDDDVHLPGVNLAIISPNWVYLKTVKINLNGLNGENMTDSARSEQPGKPGNPGGNAGDFLGVGNPNEKYLLITANGGNGGNGQNGARGKDGANNTLPDPPVGTPACTTKLKKFKNAFDQSITHYKVYSRLGCGASGTDGGVGGRGGAGGAIILVSEKFVKVKMGSAGISGLPGKGGTGGVGGRDGCFYEAYDIDDETLHQITSVKCLEGNILPGGHFGRDNYSTLGQIFPPVKENLKVHKCITQLLRFTSCNFNPNLFPLLKKLIQISKYKPQDLDDVINEYKLLETLDKWEFYELFYEQINQYIQQQTIPQPVLMYIKSLTLAQMSILKSNVNFHFIDYKNYLNLLKKSIKNTNENTRIFEPNLYLKQKLDIKREENQRNLKRIKLIFDKIQSENLCGFADVGLQFLINETFNANISRPCLMNASNRSKISSKDFLLNEKKKFWRIIENKKEFRGTLAKMNEVLHAVEESAELSNEEKSVLQGLTDELERFLALYDFNEREKLENLFFKSLYGLSKGEGIEIWKISLVNAMIALQYNSAMKTDIFSFNSTKRVEFFQTKSIIDDVLAEITLLEQNSDQGFTFRGNHLKAIFDEDSAVGEFYFWSNGEIRKGLKSLFSGGELHLKSSLINRHIFDKNFVQFTTVKLKFECNQNENECQNQLTKILAGFKIEITHSGYSYYNWEGETQVVVSEKMSLLYSFRTGDNKQPEIYNSLYKKCQDGEIKLSPFTTWSVRLIPIDKDSDLDELLPFSEKVNLRLIGSGTYTT